MTRSLMEGSGFRARSINAFNRSRDEIISSLAIVETKYSRSGSPDFASEAKSGQDLSPNLDNNDAASDNLPS